MEVKTPKPQYFDPFILYYFLHLSGERWYHFHFCFKCYSPPPLFVFCISARITTFEQIFTNFINFFSIFSQVKCIPGHVESMDASNIDTTPVYTGLRHSHSYTIR
ncbi:hypothetical protein V6Z12_D09G138200 [Gossypium hirsutum]